VVHPRQAQLICEPWQQKLQPPTGYAAKWSLPFCLAAHALGRPVDVALFEGVCDPAVLHFARCIEWVAQEDGFPDRYPGRLVVTMADGRSREGYVPDVLGGPGRRFPDEALLRKARNAAAAVLPPEDVEGLIEHVLSLQRAPSLAPIGAYLRSAQAGAREAARVMESA
jgi:2-methylcitrate dehydratase PrpD